MITTNRTHIRQLNLGDAKFIIELVNQKSWLQFIGDKKIYTLTDAENYLTNGPISMYKNHGFGLYAVENISNQTIIGICGIIKRNTLPDADLGYAFLDKFTGNGYAYEACEAVIDYAKQELNLHTILAITMPENIRSIHLLKKLNFKFKEEIQPSDNSTKLNLMILE